MLVPIRISWFNVKYPKYYKTRTVFVFLEAEDGTIRPVVQRFWQNCCLISEVDYFQARDFWCSSATKIHLWLLSQTLYRSYESSYNYLPN